MIHRLRPVLFTFFICLLVSLSACMATVPPGPTEDIRAQFGTIAIVAHHFDPDSTLQTLPKGLMEQTWEGASAGALDLAGPMSNAASDSGLGSLASASPEAGVIILGLMLVVIPPSMLYGAVKGAADAETHEAMRQTEIDVRQALTQLNNSMQENIYEHFLREARARTNYLFIPIMETAEAGEGTTVDIRSRTSQSVDTIIELSIESVELVRGIMHYPEFALEITARVKVKRADDLLMLYDDIFPYEMYGEYPLKEWTSDNAKVLAKEWSKGISHIASMMARELFTRYRFP